MLCVGTEILAEEPSSVASSTKLDKPDDDEPYEQLSSEFDIPTSDDFYEQESEETESSDTSDPDNGSKPQHKK